MYWIFRRDLWVIITAAVLFLLLISPADGKIGPLKFPLDAFITVKRCNFSMWVIRIHDLSIEWDRANRYTPAELEKYQNGAIVYVMNDTEGCQAYEQTEDS